MNGDDNIVAVSLVVRDVWICNGEKIWWADLGRLL